MSNYLKHLTETPQSEPIPGRETEMSRNNAGGYSFDVDDFARLDRFLIIGTESGTYYVGEGKLTRDNAAVVLRCIKADGVRVVNRIVEISDKGLAPKNDPAIFALALCAKNGDDATRSLAYKAVPKVCRIGTHLFQFAEAIDTLGGWGRGARKAVASWYTEKEPDKLAYQLVKYRQRNGWSHRDLLRLSHPKGGASDYGVDATMQIHTLLRYAAGKWDPITGEGFVVPPIVYSYERAKTASLRETVELINDFNLPRECINTEYLNDPKILEALLQKMPVTALVRNLGNLAKAGVTTPFSDGTKRAIDILTNIEGLRKSRIHPMAIYLAMMTYGSGQGERGSGTWTPVPGIMDSLSIAFYNSMPNVVPSGKKILFALDTSGSMKQGYGFGPGILRSPMAKAAAMALIAAKTEPFHEIIGVDTSIQNVGITSAMRLDQAILEVARHGGGGTNLSLPYDYLSSRGYDVDGIVVYTDSETWAGRTQPAQALEVYRRKMGHPVRNVVVSMEANTHTVGDLKDPLTLQCVGLDASVPQTISQFIAGEF
jgi:60 kDa SS-A/Ro ribonucleoprotein